MVKRLAIDWDERELRLVAAQCSGSNVKVTDAQVLPIEDNVLETLKAALDGKGLENSETLVAIGRGKAELRELQLPPVPEEELPDMVRFQAGKSFATAGDNAIVDYLVTSQSESGVEIIAAALGEQELHELRDLCESNSLVSKRISIRPLAAAALYLVNQERSSGNDTVLIDLLSDEAEFVVAREGRVIFVRTVRMPADEAARGRALAGELKRSLVACGSSGTLERVVLWGSAAVHSEDVKMLVEATDSKVEVLDPFSLVDVGRNAKSNMPDHVGRLAPLVGLLVADEGGADRLLDFLNPRKRIEQVENPYRRYIIAAIPLAVAALFGFLIFRQLGSMDDQIESLKAANQQKEKKVKNADQSLARTEMVDQYLDGDVNWLNEIRRLARRAPESEKLILRSISMKNDPRSGGGIMTVEGAVTKPSVIEEFEAAVRDPNRNVQGDGASEVRSPDKYRWSFTETIEISPEYVREQRYIGMNGVVDGDAVVSEEDGNPADSSSGGESEENEVANPEARSADDEDADAGQEPDSGGDEEDQDATKPVEDKSEQVEASETDESPDSPAGEGLENTPETKPETESSEKSDDEIVAEVRTEVKS